LSLNRMKCLSSHWCLTRPSSATYVANVNLLLHMWLEPWVPPCVLFGWWFSPWELWRVWLVNVVFLPMGLQTSSALQSSNSSIGVLEFLSHFS
jgi:hypothetical protein